MVGDTLTVTLKVNTGGAPINAAEGTITFPADVLQVKSVSQNGSIFTLWPSEPSSSNKHGTVSFSGGKPTPGYTGTSGTLFSVAFTAKGEGTAHLAITGAQVLANDGQGTNVVGTVGSTNITVAAADSAPTASPSSAPQPAITSATNPNQDTWYATADVSASWTGGSGVLGYSAVFDHTAATDAPQVDEGTTSAFSRSNLADGVWYLHVRAHYAAGWSATQHYRFQIDHTVPAAFPVVVTHDPVKDGTVTLAFTATDATSGVDHYKMKIDGGPYAAVTSPKILENVLPGSHRVVVLAVDRANNITEASSTFEVGGPVALAVTFDHTRVPFDRSGMATVVVGQTLRLRGYARATDIIHVVVHSTESVFDFPVAENIDPAPIEQVPVGMTAWKIDFAPTLTPGDHEMNVSVKTADGQTISEAPVIRFHVVSGAVRVGQYVIPFSLIVRAETVALVVLFAILLVFIGWIWRERRVVSRLRKSAGSRK